MDIKKWNLINVYDLMILALFVLTVYNAYTFGLSSIVSIVAIVLTTSLFELAINFIKEKRKTDGRAKHVFFPKSALITGLILGIIIQGPMLFLILISAIAILSKHIIRIKGRHIFNPANFGLFVGILLTPFLPVSQSWWGTSNILLVTVLGILVVYKLKRYHLVLPFLAVHAALMFFIFSFNVDMLVSHIVSVSLLFFTFYMLTEPVTSPSKMKSRIIFGALAGLLGAVLYVIWLPAMLVGALFFADILVPLLNYKRKGKPAAEKEYLTNPNW